MADKQMTVTKVLRQQHQLIRDLFDQVDAATGAEKAATFDCLRAILAVHETAEEELVHPVARLSGPDAEASVRRRLDEESAAKRMLADLEKMGVAAEGWQPAFDAFQEAVVQHALDEEAEIFPVLDACQDEETLRRLADALLAAERMAPTHPHPHGPESAIGNVLVGPFVAMVDRVRDAIKRKAA
jgi:hemerythrin superfamily protein